MSCPVKAGRSRDPLSPLFFYDMANPQVENGHTDIANDIMDALARTRIPGEARQVLDYIFRRTYGWHRIEEAISLKEFSEGTGLQKGHVCAAIKTLKRMSIVSEKGYRVSEKGYSVKIYAINKDFDLWVGSKKGSTRKRVQGTRIRSQMVPEYGYGSTLIKEIKERKQEALLLNVVAVDEFQVFKSMFIKKWNELAEKESQRKPKPGKIPAIMSIAEKSSREKKLRDRWREKNFTENLDRLFAEIPKSAMLCGRSDKPSPGHENWKITVDWLIGTDKNYLKVLEGNYRDGPGKGKSQMETLMEIAEGKEDG